MNETRHPVVVIVGRPNVGKSTLFNALARRRIAIEEPTAGVTRDRISALVTHQGRTFELVDTGGIGIEDSMGLSQEVERQIQYAIERADLLVFLVDVKEGITPLDEDVGRRFRRIGIPLILVGNKCDSRKDEARAVEILRLGFGEPVLTSAKQRLGREELLDLIVERLPEARGEALPRVPTMKLALVGRRNAGKSTMINAFAKEERVIVSEQPGTTRDAIDVTFDMGGERFVAIDTAGIRRKRSIHDPIDFFSMDRARKSIRRADVVLLLMDPTIEISKIEKQLASEIVALYKPCILTINKWDLARGVGTGEYANYVYANLPGIAYAPISFVSALTRLNLAQTVKLAKSLYEQAGTRVATGHLNRTLQEAIQQQPPRRKGNRSVRVYYATQTDVLPPTFVLFVSDPCLFDEEYLRYLQRSIRDRLGFPEVPVRLILKMST